MRYCVWDRFKRFPKMARSRLSLNPASEITTTRANNPHKIVGLSWRADVGSAGGFIALVGRDLIPAAGAAVNTGSGHRSSDSVCTVPLRGIAQERGSDLGDV